MTRSEGPSVRPERRGPGRRAWAISHRADDGAGAAFWAKAGATNADARIAAAAADSTRRTKRRRIGGKTPRRRLGRPSWGAEVPPCQAVRPGPPNAPHRRRDRGATPGRTAGKDGGTAPAQEQGGTVLSAVPGSGRRTGNGCDMVNRRRQRGGRQPGDRRRRTRRRRRRGGETTSEGEDSTRGRRRRPPHRPGERR